MLFSYKISNKISSEMIILWCHQSVCNAFSTCIEMKKIKYCNNIIVTKYCWKLFKSVYTLWCTGRQYCEGMLVKLRLFFLFASSEFVPFPNWKTLLYTGILCFIVNKVWKNHPETKNINFVLFFQIKLTNVNSVSFHYYPVRPSIIYNKEKINNIIWKKYMNLLFQFSRYDECV